MANSMTLEEACKIADTKSTIKYHNDHKYPLG